MFLDILPQDLVLLILTKCDVVTILRLGQTCRYLREVSLSRYLWLTLAQELDYDHAPNILPHESLKFMSSERLRETVIRATRCYLNWTSPHGVEVTRSINLNAPVHHVRYTSTLLHVLVPGGRYYVYHIGNGHFRCHDVEHLENVCDYQITSYASEALKNLDCILIEDGTVLIMAFIVCRNFDEIFTSVVRFDLLAGVACEIRKFALPQVQPEEFERFKIACDNSMLKIHNDVVVVWTPGSFMVGNLIQGEMTMVTELNRVHSINIAQGHILCAISLSPKKLIYAAAPLSLLFSKSKAECRDQHAVENYDTRSSAPVRSEDIFIHVAPLALPDTTDTTSLQSVHHVSICTSAWKCPNLREFDAPAIPTRILIYLRIVLSSRKYYMISQLDFSPVSTLPANRLSPLAAVINDSEKGERKMDEYHFTSPRYSALFYYASDFPERALLTTAARTGHAVGSFIDYLSRPVGKSPRVSLNTVQKPITPTLCAINLRNHLVQSNCEPVGQFFSRAKYSKIPGILNEEDIHVSPRIDAYSSALWYRRGSLVFIHFFD